MQPVPVNTNGVAAFFLRSSGSVIAAICQPRWELAADCASELTASERGFVDLKVGGADDDAIHGDGVTVADVDEVADLQ